MAVSRVIINADVYMVCLAHALSTEKEEIMGLLIGDVSSEKVVCISSLVALQRSDKKPDRVEISPEQLSDAAVLAERLSTELERPMRVVGWYHSHPHITVWPSHVDVRTQSAYQLMDDSFVGLVFSVFNPEKHVKGSKVEVACFQSKRHGTTEFQRVDVPLYVGRLDAVEPLNLERLLLLPKVLIEEETLAHDLAAGPDIDFRTDTVTAATYLTQLHNASEPANLLFSQLVQSRVSLLGMHSSFYTVYNQSLCRILDVLCSPIMRLLEQRIQQNHAVIAQLEEERELLLQQQEASIASLSASSPENS